MTSTGIKNKRKRKIENTTDCATDVARKDGVCATSFRRSGVRRHTSIRVDGGLWGLFVDCCRREGLSSCGVLESLIVAWMGGVGVRRPVELTVNVDMPRIVKRVRRRQIYFEDEVDVKEGKRDDVQATIFCQFCFRKAVGMGEHRKSGIKAFVCGKHREELRRHPKWVVVENGLK